MATHDESPQVDEPGAPAETTSVSLPGKQTETRPPGSLSSTEIARYETAAVEQDGTLADGPGDRRVSLPGYRIVGELGHGAMGIVYEAVQERLNRRVAIKVMSPGLGDGFIDRFRLEAEAVARLKHPNVVQVHDFGEHDGQPFLVLELVEGDALDRVIAQGTTEPRKAAEMVAKLARAVQEAHAKGIVHRDLKPSNVLLDLSGEPKVSDFGLAKQLDGESSRTGAGDIVGTPNYMAPEQAFGRNEEVGPAADVHALGAILYRLLTGAPPFRGGSVQSTLELVRHHAPAPIRSHGVRVHRDLETICLKCLEKQPADRYDSARALAEDLERFTAGEPIAARPLGWWSVLARRARRYPVQSGLATAVTVCALIGTWMVISSRREMADAREQSRDREHELEVNRPVEIDSPTGLPVVAVPADNALTAGKVALGRLLFFDPRLSVNGTIACASCHDPQHGWTNDSPTSRGADGKFGIRNAPTVVNASQHTRLFWDGRATILERQTLGPLLHEHEMGTTETRLVETLRNIRGYQARFDEVFDDGVTFSNVGRAIAAYERTLVAGDSAYDRVRTGVDPDALSVEANRGRDLFFGRAGCSVCHHGPNLTDEAFHNIGVGIDEGSGTPRNEGRRLETKAAADYGAYRTPPLRDLHRTAPYMHDGSLATLEDVVEHYARGGTPNEWLAEGIRPIDLTDTEKRELVVFLRDGLASRVYPVDRVDEFPE